MDPQNVYYLLKQIPKGRVTTYGAVAKALGKPKKKREFVRSGVSSSPCRNRLANNELNLLLF